jgi:hypothetical protein
MIVDMGSLDDSEALDVWKGRLANLYLSCGLHLYSASYQVRPMAHRIRDPPARLSQAQKNATWAKLGHCGLEM